MQVVNQTKSGNLEHGAPALSVSALPSTITGKIVIVVCASLFVAVCAHVVVPLPFTPVPLTLSDFAVLLVGLLLAPELSFAALALYLAEGAAGLPVFSPTGPGGIAQLFGLTGGYLVAYPFAAALTGALVRVFGQAPRYLAGAVAALAGTLLIMTSGAAWLGIYTHHATPLTFRLAVLPFLPGQLIKVASAAGIYAACSKHLSPLRRV